jgi:hypothetical protein
VKEAELAAAAKINWGMNEWVSLIAKQITKLTL